MQPRPRRGGSARDSEGPLAPPAGGGVVALEAPARAPYSFTVGSFTLCRDDDAETGPPVLDSVDFDVRVAPLRVQPVVRTIPAEDEMTCRRFHYSPIGVLRGRPPHLHDFDARGTFSTELAGTVVDPLCSDRDDPGTTSMELLVVMKVPRGGSDVRGFTIDYHVGDRDYAVQVPWRMIGCGARVARDLCSVPRP